MKSKEALNIIKNTQGFVKKFKEELDKIFPKGWVEDGYSMVSGTIGWTKAFDKTCDKLELNKVKKFYHELDWEDSDDFDWELEKYVLNRRDK